ncbi:unnamed protein product [Gongylonema pulchrum]|uniref:FAM91_C domain-containing protein n=1 Tax=Gongylonema pulchrum TaxID=637853 RepID=A0A183E9A6_9BILA|nr:unnamed protein product [Gongylonema pulchrum]
MAPLSGEACPLSVSSIPHFGPVVPEAVSSWFRLFLYHTAGNGPVSMYIRKGSRIPVVPRALRRCKRLLLTTSSHEPVIVPTDNCLVQLNDTLLTHAVLAQEYSAVTDDAELVSVPFPFVESDLKDGNFALHPSVVVLRNKLGLDALCGYLTLLCKTKELLVKDRKNDNAPVSKDPSSSAVQFANHDLAQSLQELIDKYQDWGGSEPTFPASRSCLPTQTVLFENGELSIVTDLRSW